MTHSSISFDFARFQHLPTKVQSLLKDRVQRSGAFSELKTLHLEDDWQSYNRQEETIICPGKRETVWSCYTHRKPAETWKGPLVNFLFSYSEQGNRFYYLDDPDMPYFHEGMQCYCWLNLWGPRLIIGLKILKIDTATKTLEIAYIEGGLYRGVQILTFVPKQNETEITHISYFKSAYRLMDAMIYPFFHNWTVGEHHQLMAKEVQQKR